MSLVQEQNLSKSLCMEFLCSGSKCAIVVDHWKSQWTTLYLYKDQYP